MKTVAGVVQPPKKAGWIRENLQIKSLTSGDLILKTGPSEKPPFFWCYFSLIIRMILKYCNSIQKYYRKNH